MENIKVVFMGTPEFAKVVLESLIDVVEVALVVTQPDKEVGRKRVLTPSPVRAFAIENGIETFTPSKIRTDHEKIKEIEPDLIVTCAYGQIIPKEVLDIPKYGSINVHGSLLPKYRGGAPIQRAIMAGDDETGITIMYMDEGMDSGDMILKKSIPIDIEDNIDSLNAKLAILGSELLLKVLPQVVDGTAPRIKQNERDVTFAPIIKKDDEILDFSKTTREVYDHIRALSPTPGAHFLLEGKKIKVYSSKMSYDVEPSMVPGAISHICKEGLGIKTKDGEIILTEVQPEGKNKMNARDYLSGSGRNLKEGMMIDERMD